MMEASAPLCLVRQTSQTRAQAQHQPTLSIQSTSHSFKADPCSQQLAKTARIISC